MGGNRGNFLAAAGAGGGGGLILVASGGVTFSGTGELGNGQGAVFGAFTNLGTFPDGAPEAESYASWLNLGPSDYFLSGGGGGGGDGGYGQLLYAPDVTGILPQSGPTAGGTSVTITGSHFTGATQVDFGSTAATQITVNSDTSITATSPAESLGTVDVTVVTAGGTSAASSADRYTYSPPFVTGVSPASGPTAGGTMVQISGGDFTGAAGVLFGGTSASSFTVISDSLVDAVAPAHSAGTVNVQVGTPGGGLSPITPADQFIYTAPAPAVTGLNPSSGSTAGDYMVLIGGSGFTGATAVLFGGTNSGGFEGDVRHPDRSRRPAHAAGTVDVTVTTPGGTSPIVAADRFIYESGQSPQFASQAASAGVPETTTSNPASVSDAALFQLRTTADSPSAYWPWAARVSRDLATAALAESPPSHTDADHAGTFPSSPAALNSFRSDSDAWVAGSSAPGSDFDLWGPLDREIQPS